MCTTDMPRMSRADIDALADRIALHAARIDAASHQLLVDIHAFDSHGGWAAQGAKSCAHWLSWRIGVGLVAAREHVRVALALPALPLVSAAMQRGELSYAKVRAMTRVANAGNEQLLLDMAKGATGAQLERICGKFRTLQRPRHDEERRFVSRRRMPDGTVRIEVRLLPDEAERVWKALQAIREELDNAAPNPAPPPVSAEATPSPVEGQPLPSSSVENDSAESSDAPPAQPRAAFSPKPWPRPGEGPYAFDSWTIEDWVCPRDTTGAPMPQATHSVRAVADASPVVTVGRPPTSSLADAALLMAERALAFREGDSAPRRPPRAERFQLFVHLREERLAATELGWQAELHDGTSLEGEALLRLACDCGLVAAKTDAQGDVLDIGRRSRRISPSLRRALLLRDRGCRFPGCTALSFVEAHHIEHWFHDGPTSLANTLLLCHRHHVAVHEGGFRVERITGVGGKPVETRFFDALGRTIPRVPSPPQLAAACTVAATTAVDDAKVALPRWNGHGLDLPAAIGALFFRDSQALIR
jgi:hypothetical protein